MTAGVRFRRWLFGTCSTAWPWKGEARPYDHVIEQEGIKVFVDPTSMMYLGGATIDYVDSLMGGGFSIDNPNAVSSCVLVTLKTAGQADAGTGGGSWLRGNSFAFAAFSGRLRVCQGRQTPFL